MELRFYDKNMMLRGVMENQTSVIWTRRYQEPGDFEIHAPITESNLRLTKRGNLVWMKGSAEAGVIEDLKLEDSSVKNEIIAKGRFLSSYMDRRLIKGTYRFSGKVETAMREILTNASAIPLVELGQVQGFEETIEFQATYKNLLEYEQMLAKSIGVGFRFRPNFDNKKIVFELYRGVDHTLNQHEHNRVIFSESYNNLNNAIYRMNEQKFRNVAYVGGEEPDNGARTVVQVGEGSGLELREFFVDARDLRQEDLSIAQYQETLKTRGREKLEERKISESFECDTGADVNFRYKTHYDLGDIVTTRKKSWGIESDLRITAIREIYEHGNRTIEPTLGDPLPEKIDWSDS